MRSFNIFYGFYSPDSGAEAEQGIMMTEAEIYSDLFGKMSQDGDFFGMVNEGRTLQFLYQAENDCYLLDLPDAAKRGSHSMELSFDQVADVLKALPERFEPEAFPGVQFHAW